MLFRCIVLFVFVSIQSLFAVQLKADEQEVNSVIDKHWKWSLTQSPVFAGQLGDRSGDGRLPDVSVSNTLASARQLRKFLVSARGINTTDLSATSRLNLQIFIRYLEDEIAEIDHKAYLIPITNRWGFHIYFAELYKRLPFNNVKDYRSYLDRLAAFREYANQNMELLRAGMNAGHVLPAVVLEGYEETISSHIYDQASKSPLFNPFTKFPESIGKQQAASLAKEGAEIISREVFPAYREFLRFMVDDYMPSASASIGVSSRPGGRGFYRHRVRKFTTLDISPEEVHETGLKEVERLRSEMESIPRKLEFEGDFNAFLEFLRTDPRFYATDAESYKKEVTYILKKMDGALPNLFGTLPRTPYGVKDIPSYIAPKTTAAYYQPPSANGKIAGFYFINTYNLKSRPLYQLEALSLHEAVPGHHLQLALQQEIVDMPNFRKFNGFTAFIEGWALYAERLGLEVGFYQDP